MRNNLQSKAVSDIEIAKIKNRLEQLLNTRSLALQVQNDMNPGSLINYGVPGFNHFSWLSEQDQAELCRLFTSVIKRQDQRLSQVNVEFLGYGLRPGLVQLRVEASYKNELLHMISNIDVLRQGIVSMEEDYG